MLNSTTKLLLIDNSFDAEQLMNTAFCKREEFAVLHVSSISGAVKASFENAFDIALLNLNVPESQGLTLQKAVQSLGSIPVIVLSESTDENAGLQAISFGAQDCLFK
jgi:DNA-binding response OmpR family regulator